jgi:hypothetical protein
MAPSQFTLERVTVEDVPAMTEIWFAAFSLPRVREVIPDTPSVRKWFADCTVNDITERPYQTYLKILDPETKDNEGKPRMVAWGKWDQSMPNERGQRFFLPWAKDMMADRCDWVFEGYEANRKKVMGEERHICKRLFDLYMRLVLICHKSWIRCVRIPIIGDVGLGL